MSYLTPKPVSLTRGPPATVVAMPADRDALRSGRLNRTDHTAETALCGWACVGVETPHAEIGQARAVRTFKGWIPGQPIHPSENQ
jgi:hypothetical protein